MIRAGPEEPADELFNKLSTETGSEAKSHGWMPPAASASAGGGLIELQAIAEELVTRSRQARRRRRGAGFARKAGVTRRPAGTSHHRKGEYYTFRKTSPGRATMEILSESLAGLILQDPFPESDVLDRARRTAFHPADPLGCGAAW